MPYSWKELDIGNDQYYQQDFPYQPKNKLLRQKAVHDRCFRKSSHCRESNPNRAMLGKRHEEASR